MSERESERERVCVWIRLLNIFVEDFCMSAYVLASDSSIQLNIRAFNYIFPIIYQMRTTRPSFKISLSLVSIAYASNVDEENLCHRDSQFMTVKRNYG